MTTLSPTSPDEMADTLSRLTAAGETIRLGGSFSKDAMGGPLAGSQLISTRALNRVLQYEPNDLTISVEAGMRWRDLETLLATNRQMIPLDPWHDESTVGGVIAANISGPRRRLFGTARDVVIGMKFATLEGKLVQSGGMVVKNVAGLDMGKLLIGSFGTLAAMTSVNFKLMPMPEQSRTFGFSHESPSAAAKQTGELLRGQLQPVAIDIMKQHDGKCGLLIQTAGTAAVVRRYQREFGIDGHEGAMEQEVWSVRQAPFISAVTVRVSCTLSEVGEVLAALPSAALARAGNGVVYGFFTDWRVAADWTAKSKWTAVIESAPQDCPAEVRWPKPGSAFATMEKVKAMFDPKRLLNPGRLYGRL